MTESLKLSNPSMYAETALASLRDSQSQDILSDIVRITCELDVFAQQQPQFACAVLDMLHDKQTDVPILFYDEVLPGDRKIRLLRPPGVLGVVPYTRNLTREIEYYVGSKGITSVLDVGCGIGLTSIAIASPDVTTVALDINNLAVQTARLNAVWNRVGDYITFTHADFIAYDTSERFDILASAPPVVSHSTIDVEAVYKRLVEGTLLLDDRRFAIKYVTDREGIPLFERMLQRADTLLNPDGIIVIANGNKRHDSLSEFVTVAERYKFSLQRTTWYPTPFNNRDRMYESDSKPFDTNSIRKAFGKVQIYADSELTKEITSPNQIEEEHDYYFRGYTVTFGRSI